MQVSGFTSSIWPENWPKYRRIFWLVNQYNDFQQCKQTDVEGLLFKFKDLTSIAVQGSNHIGTIMDIKPIKPNKTDLNRVQHNKQIIRLLDF